MPCLLPPVASEGRRRTLTVFALQRRAVHSEPAAASSDQVKDQHHSHLLSLAPISHNHVVLLDKYRVTGNFHLTVAGFLEFISASKCIIDTAINFGWEMKFLRITSYSPQLFGCTSSWLYYSTLEIPKGNSQEFKGRNFRSRCL